MFKLSHFHCVFLNVICRAGVAQYMKTEWRVVAIFNVVLFVVLVRHSCSICELQQPMTCFNILFLKKQLKCY